MTVPPDKSIAGAKAIEAADQAVRKQPASQFESHMQGAPAAPSKASGPTPMELNPTLAAGTPTFDSLVAQSKNTQDVLGTVASQLRTKNLKLKRSQSHLLRNKLTDANEAMQGASAQVGIQRQPPDFSKALTPIDRFIAYVDDGQEQMAELQAKLQTMADHPEKLNPAQMMLVQVKLSQAQQAIEYSSALLGKVIDAIKTIMNTQL